ncbi:MAG: 3-hydroxybutyryl-CoA dehydrogenase [Chitinophagaceae bacterium]|nr:3-hydroxybutyryl-CoA dehydrogenase [Chitinophagaceae bacterium]
MIQTPVQKICVCGAGTMGRGIAQLAAQSGFDTILYDVQRSVLEEAKVSIQQNLRLLEDKGKLKAGENEAVLMRLQFTDNFRDCKADLIIEAIIEKPEMKINLFNQLAGLNSVETIFATNTSSLSVSQISAGVQHREKVVGMHFFNPAPVMKLVEIVKGEYTSGQTIEIIFSTVKQLNKIPVMCKDAPGFIVNRIARPYYIESLRLVEEGYVDFLTIDALMESTGFKMGPFKLMDLIGNDINFSVSCSVYLQLGKPKRLKPSPIQEEKVKQGELGKKSGKGYYIYNSPGANPPNSPKGGE